MAVRAILLGCACALVTIQCANAASPRDAIRQLPSLTYTGALLTNSSSTTEGSRYNENFTGTWNVDWNPARIDLGLAKLKLSAGYALTLRDFADEIQRSSTDSRSETHNYTIELSELRWLEASYGVALNETYKPSGEWSADLTKNANIRWLPPGLPSLRYGYSSHGASRWVNGLQASASESETSNYTIDFERKQGPFGQRYMYFREYNRTRNYQPQQQSSSSTSRFEGYRSLPLGPIGTAVFSYTYDEFSRSDPGSSQAVQNRTNQYRVSLGNTLPGTPVSYNLSLMEQQREYAGGAFLHEEQRNLSLGFSPPVGEGRSAGLGLQHELRTIRETASSTSNEFQEITWGLQANRFTSANFLYRNESDLNLLTNSQNRGLELFNGQVEYKIPGNYGSFVGKFNQSREDNPLTGRNNARSGMELASSLTFSPGSRLVLSLTSQDNSADGLSPGSTIHQETTKVSYALNYGSTFKVFAQWRQIYRSYEQFNSTNAEHFNFTVEYDPGSNWRYWFTLNDESRDVRETKLYSADYESSNSFEARVTYTF